MQVTKRTALIAAVIALAPMNAMAECRSYMAPAESVVTGDVIEFYTHPNGVVEMLFEGKYLKNSILADEGVINRPCNESGVCYSIVDADPIVFIVRQMDDRSATIWFEQDDKFLEWPASCGK